MTFEGNYHPFHVKYWDYMFAMCQPSICICKCVLVLSMFLDQQVVMCFWNRSDLQRSTTPPASQPGIQMTVRASRCSAWGTHPTIKHTGGTKSAD